MNCMKPLKSNCMNCLESPKIQSRVARNGKMKKCSKNGKIVDFSM